MATQNYGILLKTQPLHRASFSDSLALHAKQFSISSSTLGEPVLLFHSNHTFHCNHTKVFLKDIITTGMNEVAEQQGSGMAWVGRKFQRSLKAGQAAQGFI